MWLTYGFEDESDMTKLYPPIAPYTEYKLRVSDLHEIHVQESGNPHGKPIIFLHGGPGGGIEAVYRQFFDPKVWRVILFDQRGCGQSRPFAELSENTTWDLVSDIEKIRQHLGIYRWVVFGGSWGSTLALAYALSHKASCAALILRGIFLLRQCELDWFYLENGTAKMFPEAYQQFIAPISQHEREDIVASYYKLLTSDNRSERIKAAKAWSTWETTTSRLRVDPSLVRKGADDEFAEAFARIECHYFVNKGWFESDDYLLKNAPKLQGIPGVIVQGRYDVICPPVTAWELHQAWPGSELHLIADAGHSILEDGIASRLIETTDRFGQTIDL